MNNVNKKTKIILFAGIIGAMILPFSYVEMVNAAPHENANEKAKQNIKKEKPNYEPKRNYEKKDHHNYKAVEILKELESLTIQMMPDPNNPTANNNPPLRCPAAYRQP